MKTSLMKTEAFSAKRKPRLIFQILIFFAVFTAVSMAESLILTLPMCAWIFSNSELSLSAASLDLASIMETTHGIMSNFPAWLTTLELAATVFGIILPIIYCTKIEKRSLASMGIIKKKAGISYVFGFIIGTAALSLSLFITCLWGGAEIKLNTDIQYGAILLYLLLFMIQGASEEVLVRGYFMMSLNSVIKGKHSELWAVLISSFVFAMLHILNPGLTPVAFVNLFLAGVLLAVIVIRTDNLWSACAFHTAWNFIMGNFYGVPVSGMSISESVFTTLPKGGNLASGGAFGLEGGLAVTAVTVIATVLFLIIFKKKEAAKLPTDSSEASAE